MKNTRKFTLLLICAVLALVTIFAMSGCGEEDNPPASSSSTQESHQHTYGEWNVTKQPTCTEKGSQEKACSCGDKVDEEIPATGHTEETVAGKEATCTEAGLTEGKKCSVCGETTVEQAEIPAKNHTEEVVAGKEATCTEAGLTDGKKCTVCGEATLEQEEIPAKGHTDETVEGKDATCTETGLTEGKKCTVCGETTVEQEEIPAKGHTPDHDVATEEYGIKCTECGYVIAEPLDHVHKVLNTVSGVAPDCETDGRLEYYECSCGNFFFDSECTNKINNMNETVIPANGHTEETVEGKDATCTETGLTDGKKCTVCGETTVEQEEIPAKGHTEETVEGKDATCTETGLTEGKKCSVCGETTVEQEEIPTKGHTEETVEGKDATCTETGLTDGKKCSVCGETTLEQEEIPAKGHTEETVEGKDATCTETGLTDGKKCTVCGETTVEQEEIPAKGHTEETVEGKDATCTETGLTDGKKCTVCGETTVEQEEIPVAEYTHKSVEGVCEACGKKLSLIGLDDIDSIVPSHEGGGAAYADKLFDGEKITSGFYSNNGKEYYPSAFGDYLTITLKNEIYTSEAILWIAGNWTNANISFYDAEGNLTLDQALIYSGGEQYGGDSASLIISVEEAIKVKTIVLKSIDFKWNDGRTQKTSELEIFVNACVEHNWVAATCTAPKTCTACGLTEGETTEHIESSVYSFDENYHWYACKFCETPLSEKVGHTPDHDAATEEYGVKCTECGYVIAEPLDHVHKVLNTISGTAPDCETDGRVEYYMCSCGNFFFDSECTNKIDNMNETVIPATGHTEETVEGKDATCAETGLTDGKKCTVCGETTVAQEEIPAKGHTEETVEGKDATCTEAGLTEGKKCSACGETTVAQEEIPAKGHTEETVAGKDATCTEAGLTNGKKCTVCGETTVAQKEIPAKGHTEGTVEGKDATCTETGLTDGKKCTACGETTVEQEEIPAKGHTEETVAGKAPTCNESGLTAGVKCSVCGETLTEQKEIPATGHTVIFKNNGVTVSTVKVACNGKVTAPSVSAVAGYELDGWYSEGSKWSFTNGVTKDMTLDAKWNLITYTVTFKNGDKVVEVVEFTVETESITEPSVPAKNGFTGAWESYTLGTQSIVVNAVYTSVGYTITYNNLNGASNPNKTSYTSADATFALASLSKDGCVFLGWYIDDDYAKKVTEIESGTTGNLIIYAKWAKYIDEETSGSITVEDKISGNLTGTYDYAIIDGTIVVYKDGEVTSDIAVIANLDGTYSFMSAGLASPQSLVKVDGEDYVCSVNISLGGSAFVAYVLTFTDDRIPDEQDLVLHVNQVVVDNLLGGTNISFTVTAAGKYKLSLLVGETNAVVCLNGAEITLPYEFSLAAGETIVFNVKTKSGEADTINFVLEIVKNEPPKIETEEDEF